MDDGRPAGALRKTIIVLISELASLLSFHQKGLALSSIPPPLSFFPSSSVTVLVRSRLATFSSSLSSPYTMNARPHKVRPSLLVSLQMLIWVRNYQQSMSELKLRRLAEHNQRLKEDLARPRVRVSEASSRYVFTFNTYPFASATNN